MLSRVEFSRGTRGGRYERRVEPVVGYVVHTTGSGPLRRFQNTRERRQHRYRSPLDAAVRTYQSLMDAGPEVVIGQCGSIVRVSSPDLCPWHVGSTRSEAYRRAGWDVKKACSWWKARWPGLESPADLCDGLLWNAGSVNEVTRGVEVVPPEDGGAWSEACQRSLARLLRAWRGWDQVELSPTTVLTHSDVHPLLRTRQGLPWDPAPAQWPGPHFVGALLSR
jgi:hypothetical protein